MASMRKETDSLGVVEVPADKLWGAQRSCLVSAGDKARSRNFGGATHPQTLILINDHPPRLRVMYSPWDDQ
jgi:fumarate hydratase class II